MKCAVVKIGGTTAIVCGRGPEKKCCECKKARASRLCDWKMPGTKTGTCDKPLCDVCAFPPAHKKDLCQEHAKAFKEWRARQDAKAAVK